MRTLSLLALVFLLAGCNSFNLRYKAQPQPNGANLFADFTPLQDAVGIPIDTDGRRIEEVYVKKSDGTRVNPLNVVYPGFGKSAALGTGVGIGTGHLGLGTGLAIPFGPERSQGLTTATFSTTTLGPAPWELHVKLQGIDEAIIPGIGGSPTAK